MNIKLADRDSTIESLPGLTILETLEVNNIQAPYHCRDGFCGACRANLEKGEIKYKLEPLANIRDGEFLTCCSTPISDIEINFD
ncbi:ferredoxin [Colwellia chukchiensis]|uniref:Ferredoxin n=1 Tax=Colwellia chukchiensis TaxID=641665 RepID=A0A1H7MIS9_9GAMM|nr:class I ribonucleotide reductase maintenance protein YfaE [Colwellia chukchiensis]SEL10517.1 ferredoxin [Colwellia chukchiensis]